MDKKHTFTQELGERRYCGDSYCGGHTQWITTCSCGKTFTTETRLTETQKILHVLDAEGLM